MLATDIPILLIPLWILLGLVVLLGILALLGRIQGGRYLKFNNLPHPTVLVSAANIMGLPITSFGNPGWQKGALLGL